MANTWKWPEMNMCLDLNLATFQYIDGFRCYHFSLNRFGLQITVIVGSVLGLQVTVWLQVNIGLQPPTRWEPFVAGTMLRRPKPTKEGVEPTILSKIAIEITHLTRFAMLLLLRILRYMWRNHVTTWLKPGMWKRKLKAEAVLFLWKRKRKPKYSTASA